MFYSKSTCGFYSAKIHSGNIPEDAVKITDELYNSLMHGQSQGKQIVVDAHGFPISQDIPDSPVHVLLSNVKNELRTLRRDMLDSVTGIGFRANVAGNTVLAQEAAQVSLQLLDITADQALNAAQTYDDMRAAGMAAYRRIADGVSPGLRSAFKELEQ